DTSPFLGPVAVALALLAVAAGWKDRRVRWLAAFTAVGIVYSLGAFTPLHGFLYALVPNLEKARLPVRALHLVSFGLALLAAFGFDALLRRESEAWNRRTARALGVYGLFVVAVLVAGVLWHKAGDSRAWISGFSALVGAAAMGAYGRKALGPKLLATVLFGLVLTELTGLVAPMLPYRGEGGKELKFTPNLERFRDIGQFLKRQEGWPRAVVNDTDVPVNLGDQEGIEMHQGYVAGIPESLFRMELHLPRIQQLIGITHWVSRKPERPEFEDVFTGASGVKVFRVPDAMPRAWTVHEAEAVRNFDELNPKLLTVDFQKKAVLIGEAPRLETCAGEDSVKILRKAPDRVTVAVEARCRGLLVVGDSYFPGWRVKIDGQPSTVIPVDGMLRGIVVDSGRHTVDMIYRPLSVLGGAALTLLGLLAALLLRLRG
ncbi:MAG: hypothetical protein NTY38_32075, partial [Acidobacteria bacterium]|nr:hypothetical protein [Acidobacteriota bacterium]